MRTRGAVSQDASGKFKIIEMDLEEPRSGEITVKMVASGMCISDHHLTSGAWEVRRPICGGHEGAGVVSKVGPNTSGWAVGDHVLLSALPACGHCRFCATGRPALCDLGNNLFVGDRISEPGSFRLSHKGVAVGQFCGIGTFSELSTVSVLSAIKIPNEMPLDKACLIGCGVSTGWGATVNSGEVKPGQTVIVMGCGGVGIFAIQGAVHAGALNIIGVDPVERKRKYATGAGATHVSSNMDEATQLAKKLNGGEGADCTAIALGEMKPEHLLQAQMSVGRGGTVVCTALGDSGQTDCKMSVFELTMSQKRIQGSRYGEIQTPWGQLQLVNMYLGGRLKLDEAVSATYSLDHVNEGYEDLSAGKNLRGVILFDRKT